MDKKPKIIGRYAPSPTGALHLGNLRTALLAWLQVRLQDGDFLMRIEDLDTPRVVDASANKMLKDLEWLGLDWDGRVVYQSQRHTLYQDALEYLQQQDLVYPCFCSRKDIQQAASAPHAKAGVYPGVCRVLNQDEKIAKARTKAPAIRLKVHENLANSCGDFVIKRADGLFAYQLAVVVDDLEQGVTDVLRGKDLFDSTERQHYLAKILEPELTPIRYCHAPLMYEVDQVKMSKRDGSFSLDEYKDKGYTKESLIGLLAYSIGLIDNKESLSAPELLDNLTYSEFLSCLN